MKKLFLYLSLAFLVLTSCQKENYPLEISGTDPVLIVDARVQSHAGNAICNLSSSTDFFGDNPQKYVKDASVFLSVNGGAEQMLEYIDGGDYRLDTVETAPGTEYTLRIVWEGEEYIATSRMLDIVPINTFFLEEAFGPPGEQQEYNFNMLLNIDLSETDYYLTETTTLDTIDTQIDVVSGDTTYITEFDNYGNQQWDDGAYSNNPALFPYFSTSFVEGDSVRVRFSQIPLEVFDFYNSLSEVGGQNPSSLAPANPTSNFTNGAIGTFGAFATYTFYFRVAP